MKNIAAFAFMAMTIAVNGTELAADMGKSNEMCEPARLTGQARAAPPLTKAGERLAQGPGMMRGPMGHGPGMGMGGMMRGRGMGRGMGNPVRHRYVMMGPGLPAAYAALKNPLPATAQNIAAGKKLYEENCASCHGAKGQGDGEAGKELSPPPANLAFTLRRPIATDGFLMWTISEGGEKLKTAMPAFRDVLNERQRWQLILYLRHGLR